MSRCLIGPRADLRRCPVLSRTRLRRMSSLRPRKRAKRTSVRACRAPRRGLALARGGFWLCCGRRGLGGYPRDGLLSLFHGTVYVGHQLFQIVLGVFKLRRLCVHFHLPIRTLLRRRGLACSIQGQSEQSLKTLRRESFLQRTIPGGMEQRSNHSLSLLSARLRAVAVRAV
jgi:hypothetical protein